MKDENGRREFFAKVSAGLGITLLPTDVVFASEDGKATAIRGNRAIWFIDEKRVNIDDLCSPMRDHKIVRCDGNPSECVMVYEIQKAP